MFLTTSMENLQQTQRLQIKPTVQPTGVGLSTVYKICSEAKYIGSLFTSNSRFFIPEVDEKITELDEKKNDQIFE